MLRKILFKPLIFKNVDLLHKPKHVRFILTNQQLRQVHNESKFKDEYTLRDFIRSADPTSGVETNTNLPQEEVPYINSAVLNGDGQKVYFEIYGCQMNYNDAEVAWAILQGVGYQRTTDLKEADIVLLITCALREGAESKIWSRLSDLKDLKRSRVKTETRLRPKIGLLGCMAERLKEKVLEVERGVDLIAGPDSYKDLPRLLALNRSYRKAVNVLLSLDETYADITPVRLDENSVTAFVSVMRGCNNMCTYCIVPFTRGRERSRPVDSIIKEIKYLSESGVKEVTLLGQNVNSYRYLSEPGSNKVQLAKGFKTVYKLPKGGIPFAELLDRVADVDPEMRIRFVSPHPKDFPDGVLEVIKNRPNICKSIHLPAQSGNSLMLEKMRRGYTREAYLELVDKIKEFIPHVTLSSDFILGFCGETEEQFRDTLSLVEKVRYNRAFVYAYSMREKTTAHHRYVDDIPNDIKLKRVAAVLETYRNIADELNKSKIGQYELILIEGNPRRSDQQFFGRNDGNIKVIIPKDVAIAESYSSKSLRKIEVGDYICVKIHDATSQILKGTPLYHTTLQDYHKFSNDSRCRIAV